MIKILAKAQTIVQLKVALQKKKKLNKISISLNEYFSSLIKRNLRNFQHARINAKY